MSSKYVLASGCSWTDPNFKSIEYLDYDCSFPKWPELFADRLDLPVLNLGRSGASNQLILNSIIEPLADDHENIECVVIGLSEAWRLTLFSAYNINLLSSLTANEESLDNISRNIKPFAHYYMVNNMLNANSQYQTHYWKLMITDYLNIIIKIQKLCKAFNKKLVITSMFGPIWFGSLQTLAKHHNVNFKLTRQNIVTLFINDNLFFKVDPNSFMGWPIFSEIKGDTIQREVYDKGFRVGEKDGHPNAKGHELIAEKIYDFYKKTYL